MPTLFRTMKADTDGLPVVGDQAKELGVRAPPNPNADVDVDAGTSLVVRNGKGMSVVSDWRRLPMHLVPARLAGIVPKARGSNDLRCYRIGDGPFLPGPLTPELELVLKPGSTVTGNIVPTNAVSIGEFQTALAATRPFWTEDES